MKIFVFSAKVLLLFDITKYFDKKMFFFALFILFRLSMLPLRLPKYVR